MSVTTRTSAARRTRMAQVAGLAMVALAAGAVMLRPGLPERAESTGGLTDLPVGQDPNENASTSDGNDQAVGIEHDRVGSSLNGSGGVEDKQETTEVAKGEDDPPPVVPTDTARGWMYLGGIFEPRTSFAFVSVAGQQRIIRAGQELADLGARVISIEPERIEIEVDGARQRIDRSEAAETMVSVSSGAVPMGSPGIIPPGSNEAFDRRELQRQELESNPDLDKRRAEFLRRQRERQGLEP